MPWPLREISGVDEAFKTEREQGIAATIGMFWRGELDTPTGTIPCFNVILPPGGVRHHFNPQRGKWTVTGELPNVTVSPSILMHGVYHGYIRDGVLTDDVDGRTFPPSS